MTIEQLSRLRVLNREASQLRERLGQLRAVEQGRTLAITGLPAVTSGQARREYQGQIAKVERLLQQRLEECLGALQEIESFLNSLGDSEIRLLLALRYVNGFTWQQVAFHMGATDEQWARRRHNAFFKEQNKSQKSII